MSYYALRADNRQLILEALDRQHDDLRRKAASWPGNSTPRCVPTTGSARQTAVLDVASADRCMVVTSVCTAAASRPLVCHIWQIAGYRR